MSIYEHARAFKLELAEAPTFQMAGTLWRVLATGAQTSGIVGALDERCAVGPPMHVHDDADEIFYVLDGKLTFFVGKDHIEAAPGTFVYLPRYVYHGFRVDSAEAHIFNFVTPAGFEKMIVENGKPARFDEAPILPDPNMLKNQDPKAFADLWKRYHMRLLPEERE